MRVELSKSRESLTLKIKPENTDERMALINFFAWKKEAIISQNLNANKPLGQIELRKNFRS